MNRVLWITSYFPPRVEVATIRSVKLLKYLPAAGWSATVVSPREALPETPASRRLTGELPPSIRHRPLGVDPDFRFAHVPYVRHAIDRLPVPDGHVIWVVASLPAIERLVREQRPDAVLTSCGPFSLNLIGQRLRARYSIPWVTDFRDLWTLNPYFRSQNHALRRLASTRLERGTRRDCDAIVLNTERSAARMLEAYPEIGGKVHVIPNGFDPEDLPAGEPPPRLPRSLLFAGSIYEGYEPAALLERIARSDAGGWELHYAGRSGRAFQAMLDRSGLAGTCQIHDHLELQEYYDLLARVEFVLLSMPDSLDTRSWVPARLYDFLGTRKRIVCLASRDSEVAHLLEAYGNALVLAHEDPAETSVARLAEYLRGGPDRAVSDAFLERFDRRALARRLAGVLDAVLAPGP